jgi:hypothetical protein
MSLLSLGKWAGASPCRSPIPVFIWNLVLSTGGRFFDDGRTLGNENMVKASALSLTLVIDLQVQSMTGGRSGWTAIPYLPRIPGAFGTRHRGRTHQIRIAPLR